MIARNATETKRRYTSQDIYEMSTTGRRTFSEPPRLTFALMSPKQLQSWQQKVFLAKTTIWDR